MIPLSGFTIVRNASILNYPFVESVKSALPLCDEFIINCGQSDDDTRELCRQLEKEFPDKVRVVESNWERSAQTGGFQLRHQTDRAADECRHGWCFYLQADEVLHEDDLTAIRRQLEIADKMAHIDGLVFDYLHFYVSYDFTMRGRNWYRREVRIFRNRAGIRSFRDAQGFRRDGKRLKALPAHARIFHYGYVRCPKSLRQKSIEMAQWWGEVPRIDENDLRPVNHVGLTRFTQSHPAVMADRIDAYTFRFEPRDYPRKWNRDEFKNAITLAWESIFPWRIGEFRNYDLV